MEKYNDVQLILYIAKYEKHFHNYKMSLLFYTVNSENDFVI